MELSGQAEYGQGRQQGDGDEARIDHRRSSEVAEGLGDRVLIRHAKQQDHGEHSHGHEGGELDQRLQRHRPDQAAVVLGQVRPARSEQDGEAGEHHRHDADREPFRSRHGGAGGDELPGHGERGQLQGDVGQGADDGDAGD